MDRKYFLVVLWNDFLERSFASVVVSEDKGSALMKVQIQAVSYFHHKKVIELSKEDLKRIKLELKSL